MKLSFVATLAVTLILAVASDPHKGRTRRKHVKHQKPREYLPGRFKRPITPIPFGDVPTSDLAGRIVGGANAKILQVPHQLMLVVRKSDNKNTNCGGVFVRAFGLTFGLTAAHCVVEEKSSKTVVIDASRVRVVAAEHNTALPTGRERRRTAAKVVAHEDFDITAGSNLNHNIAIVFIKPAFQTNSVVKTIQLPGKLWKQPDTVTISGWGSTTKNPPNAKWPDILQVVEVKTYNSDSCSEDLDDLGYSLSTGMLCLWERGVKKGSCSGDSGGPATAKNKSNGRIYVAGLASFHFDDCDQFELPRIYTKISNYIDCIKDEVNAYKILDKGRRKRLIKMR